MNNKVCPICKFPRGALFLCITEDHIKLVCCIHCAVEFCCRLIEELKEERNGEPKVEGRDLPEG